MRTLNRLQLIHQKVFKTEKPKNHHMNMNTLNIKKVPQECVRSLGSHQNSEKNKTLKRMINIIDESLTGPATDW